MGGPHWLSKQLLPQEIGIADAYVPIFGAFYIKETYFEDIGWNLGLVAFQDFFHIYGIFCHFGGVGLRSLVQKQCKTHNTHIRHYPNFWGCYTEATKLCLVLPSGITMRISYSLEFEMLLAW